MGFIAVYITHENEKAANLVCDYLLNKKVIACANIFPISSSYWWSGKIANEKEWVSIVKTSTNNWKLLEKEVMLQHPYEVPCIMKMEVTANEAYEKWIHESVIDSLNG